MLSVNSAIVGFYGYLQSEERGPGQADDRAGCRDRPKPRRFPGSRAKFEVLAQLEADLPVPPFTREREIYQSDKRRPLSQIEISIPTCFALLYAVMLGAAFFK